MNANVTIIVQANDSESWDELFAEAEALSQANNPDETVDIDEENNTVTVVRSVQQ